MRERDDYAAITITLFHYFLFIIYFHYRWHYFYFHDIIIREERWGREGRRMPCQDYEILDDYFLFHFHFYAIYLFQARRGRQCGAAVRDIIIEMPFPSLIFIVCCIFISHTIRIIFLPPEQVWSSGEYFLPSFLTAGQQGRLLAIITAAAELAFSFLLLLNNIITFLHSHHSRRATTVTRGRSIYIESSLLQAYHHHSLIINNSYRPPWGIQSMHHQI